MITPEVPTQVAINDILTSLVPQYRQEVWSDVRQMVREAAGELPPAASFALEFTVAQGLILRPLVALPVEELQERKLLVATGGEAYNPHRRIDTIGKHVFYQLLAGFEPGESLDVYNEEDKGWRTRIGAGRGLADPLRYHIVIDSLDGTSNIEAQKPYIAAGILVADESGRFLAASVASLTSPEVLLVEPGSHRLFWLDWGKAVLTPGMVSRLEDPIHHPLRLAILGRRIPDLKAGERIDNVNAEVRMDTFGGYGLLSLFKGETDSMLDPTKGQVWYEAALWGYTAQEAGCVVSRPDGRPIDFPTLIMASCSGADMPRTPMVISRNSGVHAEVSSYLGLG